MSSIPEAVQRETDNSWDSKIRPDIEHEINRNSESFTKAVDLILVILVPAFFTGGCVCHVLTLIVFSRRAFRGTTSSIFFRFLALMDMGAIMTGLPRLFYASVSRYDIWQYKLTCRVLSWLNNIFIGGSSWTLVALTCERLVSIIWPYKVRQWCSHVTAKLLILGVFLLLSAIYGIYFAVFGDFAHFDKQTNTTITYYCTVIYRKENLTPYVYFQDGAIYAYIPFLFLTVSNVVIGTSVSKSRKRVLKMSDISVRVRHSKATVKRQARVHRAVTKKDVSLSRTLLVINTAFILLNFPLAVYQLSPNFVSEKSVGPVGDTMVYLLFFMMHSNNSLNFLFYCAMGSRFRKETMAAVSVIIPCCLCKTNS